MSRKRILLVTHDPALRASRVALLEQEGYKIDIAVSDGDAISMLRTGLYDLVLIGRNARAEEQALDERLAASGTEVPVFKIDDRQSVYAHAVGTNPAQVMAEVRRFLSAP